MAIRNIALGGASDWAIGENMVSQDLNDTFNAAAEKVKTLSAFWLNSYLYDVYDDFESYSVGTFTTNSKWDITLAESEVGCNPQANIVSSTNAGGTGKELKLTANTTGVGTSNKSSSSTATTKLLVANRHTFVKIAYDVSKNTSSACPQTYSFGNATDGWSTIYTRNGASSNSNISTEKATILVVAKGSNVYDVYWCGQLSLSSVSKPNGAQLQITSADGGDRDEDFNVYVDDVIQCKSTIQ